MFTVLTSPPRNQITALVITWVLLLPLLFLAIHGQPWFLGPNVNFYVPIGAGAIAGQQRSAGQSALDLSVKIAIVMLFYALAISRFNAIRAEMKRNRLLMMTVLLALASAAWSQFPVTTVEFSIVLISNITFAAFLAVRFDSDEQMRLFTLIGVSAALCTIGMVLFAPNQGIDLKEGSTSAWQGIFNHKNDCAIVLSYLLTACFFSNSLRRMPLLRIICSALMLLVIILSESRTGWILVATLFIYLANVAAISRFTSGTRQLLYLLAACFSVAIAIALVANAPALFLAIGKSANATGRTGIWMMALNFIWKRPILGYGYHAFFMGMQGASAGTSLLGGTGVPMLHAQSGFLDNWLELGIVGLGILVLTIIRSIRDGFFCLVRRNTAAAQWYLAIVLLTVVANIGERNLMCCNFLDFVMYVMAYIGLSREAKAIRLREREAEAEGFCHAEGV